jgi:hypothetical protein
MDKLLIINLQSLSLSYTDVHASCVGVAATSSAVADCGIGPILSGSWCLLHSWLGRESAIKDAELMGTVRLRRKLMLSCHVPEHKQAFLMFDGIPKVFSSSSPERDLIRCTPLSSVQLIAGQCSLWRCTF